MISLELSVCLSDLPIIHFSSLYFYYLLFDQLILIIFYILSYPLLTRKKVIDQEFIETLTPFY